MTLPFSRALVAVLAVLTLASCPKREEERPASLPLYPRSFDARCGPADQYANCMQSCLPTGQCCPLPCTTNSGCANGTCAYQADTANGCTCFPGECSADGKSVCGCSVALDGTVNGSAWQTCPADFPICDPVLRTCACDPAAPRTCTSTGDAVVQCSGGSWVSAKCPPDAPLCRNGVCGCVANAGGSCGQGGTVGCTGTCVECSPGSSRQCACGGGCSGRAVCGQDQRWGPCQCGSPSCNPGWALAGNGTCTFSQTDPGAVFTLPGGAKDVVLLASQMPVPCRFTNHCSVTVQFGPLAPCPGGSLSFRCDGNASTDFSLLLDGIHDTYPGENGPQLTCQEKVELLSDPVDPRCSVTVVRVVWNGTLAPNCR